MIIGESARQAAGAADDVYTLGYLRRLLSQLSYKVRTCWLGGGKVANSLRGDLTDLQWSWGVSSRQRCR